MGFKGDNSLGDDPKNWSDADKAWANYMYGGGDVGQGVQGAYNFLSNPIGGVQHLINTGGKGSLSDNYGGQATSLTNPLQIDLNGKYGSHNGAMTRDVFNSMSDEDWATFRKLPRDKQNQFIAQRTNDIQTKGSSQDAVAKAQADAQAKDAEYQKWRTDVMTRLDQFSQKMNMSVEELISSGDLGVRAARNDAAAAAGRRGVGLSGGASDLNTQRAVADAGLKYQMGRQQLGLQATQGLQQGLQQQYMNTENRRQYEQGLNLQLQSAQAAAQNQKYAQEQQQAGGLTGMVGTVLGGIWGGAPGAKAGGELGQGYGQMQYGQQNPYQPYQYQYPSGQGGGLGGNGNNGQSGWGGWSPYQGSQ